MNNEYEIDYEEQLIGLVINNPTLFTEIGDSITDSDFINEIYGQVYKVIFKFYEKVSNFNISYAREELIRHSLFDKLGGDVKFAQLINNLPFDSNVFYIIDMIKEKSLKLRLLKMCSKITTSVNRDLIDSKTLIDEAQQTFFDTFIKGTNLGTISLSTLFQEKLNFINSIDATMEFENGIKTGFKNYDELTGGLQKSDLLILAARPGGGKTAFSLNIAISAAKQGKKVLLFSLEMGKDQLLARVLSIITGINLNNIRKLTLSNEEMGILSRLQSTINNYNIEISESNDVTINDIKNQARKMKVNSDMGLDLVIIDYLQLIKSTGSREIREQQVAEISRSLKILAKELDIPIIALAQLSRGVELRTDKRPLLSDLRESGSIEQDADQVIFLYENKEQPSNNQEFKNIVLSLSKHRNGSTGDVKLEFYGKNQRFVNVNEFKVSEVTKVE